MNGSRESSIQKLNESTNTGADYISCNESLWNFLPHDEADLDLSNATEQLADKETYLERSLGFLIVGGIGIISNLFAILVWEVQLKLDKNW